MNVIEEYEKEFKDGEQQRLKLNKIREIIKELNYRIETVPNSNSAIELHPFWVNGHPNTSNSLETPHLRFDWRGYNSNYVSIELIPKLISCLQEFYDCCTKMNQEELEKHILVKKTFEKL